MWIGYARVSTDEQSLDLQLDALKKAGCKRVFTDKASATKADRPGLAGAISQFRSGDVLVIWKLDRLGRTVKGLVDFVADLQGRGVQFRSLTDGIDTTTPAGRFFFHVMASLAQMERELLAERTRAGLAVGTRWPGRLHHASLGWLPAPRCGITTCSIEQLTRPDFHRLDHRIVGCSIWAVPGISASVTPARRTARISSSTIDGPISAEVGNRI